MTSGLSFQEEYDLVKSYSQEYSVLLPWETLRDEAIPGVLKVTVFVYIMSFVIHGVVAWRNKEEKWNSKQNLKAVYLVTNAIVNLLLAVVGIYYFRDLPTSQSFEELMAGRVDLVFMGACQLGYNLWAFPYGLFLVNESLPMLCHHLGVIFVAGIPTFCTLGIRHYAPFFFGVIEGSSVPLVVMNAFKDNKVWRDNYPGFYKGIRYCFAFTFLYLRWYLYMPRKYNYLRLQVFTTLTAKAWYVKAYFGVGSFSAALIALLQLYWGSLIVKGLVKSIMPSKPKKKEE